MGRRILVLDRSPLARNIYSMILSGLDQINIVPIEPDVSSEKFQNDVVKSDLVMMRDSTIGERQKEFLDCIKNASKEKDVPCILFVNEDQVSEWKDYAEINNVTIMERPFFPDELLQSVAKEWGVKV